MTDVQDDFPAHEQTYQSFNKLVLFSILFIILLLSAWRWAWSAARAFSRWCWASAAPWRC